MKYRLRLAVLPGVAVLILHGLAALSNGRPADGDAASQVQALTSGPVHEAFAQPGSASLEPPPLVDRAPPEPLSEDVPDEKPDGDNVQWIGGYWDYVQDLKDFAWVTGVWRIPPPEHQWVSTYWSEKNAKWQRTPGFWSPFSGEKEQQEITYSQPPPDPEEEDPGEAPDDDSDFEPGSWDSDGGNGFTWRRGRWIRRQPGWKWRPPSFSWSPKGWIRQRGFWDLALARRGVPFAPLRVPAGLRGAGKVRLRPTHAIDPATMSKSLLRTPGGKGFRVKGAKLTTVNKIPGVKSVRVTPQQRANLTKLANDLRKVGQQRRQRETLGSKTPLKTPVRDRFVLPKPRGPKSGDKKLTPPPTPKSIRLAKKSSGTTTKPNPGGKLTGSSKKPRLGTTKPGLIKPVRKTAPPKTVVKKPAEKKPVRKTVVKKPTGSKPVVKAPQAVKKPIRATAMKNPVKAAPARQAAPPPKAAPVRKPGRRH